MLVSCEASGAGGWRLTCGNEISSATNGSSVRIVAGKNRSPAQPCASAAEFMDRRATAAQRPPPIERGSLRRLPMEMPKRRAMKRWPQQLRVTAGSGGGRSAGAVSGWNAGAFSLDYEMRRRQPRRERDRQRRRTGWRQAGQGAERAAHGTRVMFVVLIGLAIRVAMAAEHRQQRPFGITDLGVGSAQMRRLERFG